jgi:SAM-dependent methyltransferase
MSPTKTVEAATPHSTQYWNGFYAQRSSPQHPSQFCLFALGELQPDDLVVDLGCGRGRDSLFFAQQGWRVLGVDASDTAVDSCREQARERGLGHAEFLCSTIESESLLAQLQAVRDRHSGRVFLYSRFFLHAIDAASEERMLQLVKRLTLPGEMLALEFRTWRDEMLRKSTPDHFRRFVDPTTTIGALTHAEFEIRYFVEGFGFAKYKDDDAHVCRILAARQ